MAAPTPVPTDYSQPALPVSPSGFYINCLDYQILTKSDGWNQGHAERIAEFQEARNVRNINYISLAVPYDNLTKFTNYVNDARLMGFAINFRSHWNGWQGDNGWDSVSGSNSTITHSGAVATCTTAGAHGLVTGQFVTISGATSSEYNGVFAVTVTGSTTFTYTMLSTPASNASVAGNWQLQLGLTASGTTVTGKSVKAHGLYVGATIIIQGATATAYNGRFTVVSVPDTLTFTYTANTSPGTSPDTGYAVLRYDRQTYLDKTYDFIVANPTLFKAGDMFAFCVEPQEADGASNPTFHTDGTNNTSFDYSLYNQFCKDQVRFANWAFTNATGGLAGKIHTWAISMGVSNMNLNGQSVNTGGSTSTGNSSGLGDADFVNYFAGRVSIDHYVDSSVIDAKTYKNQYSLDIQSLHAAFPSCKIYIGEWGFHTQTDYGDIVQHQVYSAVLQVIRKRTFIIGFNAWNHLGQTQSSIWKDSSGTVIPGGRKAVNALRKYFNLGTAGNPNGPTTLGN